MLVSLGFIIGFDVFAVHRYVVSHHVLVEVTGINQHLGVMQVLWWCSHTIFGYCVGVVVR
jgi:hypothetical protein